MDHHYHHHHSHSLFVFVFQWIDLLAVDETYSMELFWFVEVDLIDDSIHQECNKVEEEMIDEREASNVDDDDEDTDNKNVGNRSVFLYVDTEELDTNFDSEKSQMMADVETIKGNIQKQSNNNIMSLYLRY